MRRRTTTGMNDCLMLELLRAWKSLDSLHSKILYLAKNPSLSFLCETKLLAREVNYRFSFPSLQDRFVVEVNGRSGGLGLILFWSINMNINIMPPNHLLILKLIYWML